MASNIIFGNDDIFEINDFTVVTEFEIFVLSLENAVQELHNEVTNIVQKNTFLPNVKIKVLSETRLEYENCIFQLEYIWQDMNRIVDDRNKKQMNVDEETEQKTNNFKYLCQPALNFTNFEHDFFEHSVIARQYGISSDYYILYPIGKNNFFPESRVNTIQSAINIASLNLECELPFFFQFSNGASIGVMQNRNCCTTFENVVLNSCLNKHCYLDGILEMFRQKMNAPIGHHNHIKVSLQLDFQKPLISSAAIDLSTNLQSTKCTHTYPFQMVDSTLIKEMCLAAIWIDLPEHYFTENETYTNIDVYTAHKLKFSIQFDREFSFEHSYNFSRLLEEREEEYSKMQVKNLIPPSTTGNTKSHSLAANAFGPLINNPTLDFELLPKMNIFEDEDLSHANISSCFKHMMENVKKEAIPLEQSDTNPYKEELMKKLALVKSAPHDSLVYRLAICMMSRIDKNLVGFCRIWMKFLDVMRHHWDYNLDLPGFDENEKPDLSSCLLNQKLQMLQYCINVKRRNHTVFEYRNETKSNDFDDFIPVNEDEFFDAVETFEQNYVDHSISSKDKPDLPQGRNHRLDPPEFIKMNERDEIYVPITQELGPMTEDQLDMHESYLLSLADSNLRNEVQSELLLSDMQAFKAANPSCVLEDFLRWHSPRDLIDGTLSERMKLPGNLWQTNWDMARPIPACKQNRLFNETKEVEKIFEFLTNISLKQLIDLIFPIVSVQMTEILIKIVCSMNAICIEALRPMLDKLMNDLHYSANATNDRMDVLYDVSASLHRIEEFIIKYSTVMDLFVQQANKINIPLMVDDPRFVSFVVSICDQNIEANNELSLKNVNSEIQLPNDDSEDSALVVVLQSLMSENDEKVDEQNSCAANATRKQIILRNVMPKPGPCSREMPQRMYTSHRDGEFLLCVASTSDVTFM